MTATVAVKSLPFTPVQSRWRTAVHADRLVARPAGNEKLMSRKPVQLTHIGRYDSTVLAVNNLVMFKQTIGYFTFTAATSQGWSSVIKYRTFRGPSLTEFFSYSNNVLCSPGKVSYDVTMLASII